MKKYNSNPLKLHIDGRMIYMSGIGRCLREIIKEITSMEKNIKINLYCSLSDYQRYIKEYSIDDSLIYFRESSSPIYSIREQVLGSWNNLIDNNNDVFYYPQYNLPFVVQKNSIFTIHDFIQFKFPEYFGKNKIRIAKLILGNAVRKAKKIIVVSKSTAKDFYNFFPHYKGEVEVIYNGVSRKFRVIKDEEKKFFLKRNKLDKYILFIGNNKPHKNITGLINAFLEIKKEFTDFKLVIISRDFDLKVMSVKKAIKDDIIVLDSVSDDELIYYYNCAFIFVLPSSYEGFGLPVIEAMACGCPVIASNISSMPEIGGDAAYFIDPYDIKSIKDGIIGLIKDNGLRKKLIKKGHSRADLFSWKDTARKYLEVFKGSIDS